MWFLTRIGRILWENNYVIYGCLNMGEVKVIVGQQDVKKHEWIINVLWKEQLKILRRWRGQNKLSFLYTSCTGMNTFISSWL